MRPAPIHTHAYPHNKTLAVQGMHACIEHAPYSEVMGFIMGRVSMAVARAVSMCIRASRNPFTGNTWFMQDGAALAVMLYEWCVCVCVCNVADFCCFFCVYMCQSFLWGCVFCDIYEAWVYSTAIASTRIDFCQFFKRFFPKRQYNSMPGKKL